MLDLVCNNYVLLEGEVVTDLVEKQTQNGYCYNVFKMRVPKDVDKFDFVPIIAPKKICDNFDIKKGSALSLSGEVRSFRSEGKLLLDVSVSRILECQNKSYDENNLVKLGGYVCKKPKLVTENEQGRIISFMLAVKRNTKNQKEILDYIPCITYDEISKVSSTLTLSNFIKLDGRFQRRMYSPVVKGGINDKLETFDIKVTNINELKTI